MDPNQFLFLAEALLRDHAHAAGWRTAVSRGYYAAHHVIREFVESAGVTILKGASAHADVWRHLAETHDLELERVANDLFALHSARVDADYRLTLADAQNQSTAAGRVAHARTLIELVWKCRADSPRYERVKKAIQLRHRVLRGN